MSSMRRVTLITVASVLFMIAAAGAQQHHFATADEAMRALVAAAKADDAAALRSYFGKEGEDIVDSGDPVADQNARRRFADRSAEATAVETISEDRAIVTVGADEWPFPVPLVREKAGWRFDSAAGREEIINRRVGRNELNAIAVAQAYVEAQREYYELLADRGEKSEYAQRILSSEGKRDGLYWLTAEDEPPSPFGPLVAEAADEGYDVRPSTYHGYRFRVLNAQGASAPGGARSYMVDGRMTGGFALIAYPSRYGVNGVTTFIVNQQGVVFEKDLGADTETVAGAITAYDPDRSWVPAIVE